MNAGDLIAETVLALEMGALGAQQLERAARVLGRGPDAVRREKTDRHRAQVDGPRTRAEGQRRAGFSTEFRQPVRERALRQ